MKPAVKGADDDRAQSEMPFDQFYLKRRHGLKTEADFNGRRRIALAIMMNKRNRGDMFGFVPMYDDLVELEYIPVSEAGLMKWQIFEQTVRANNANVLNVRNEFIWEAATGDPDAEAAAELANSISDYIRQRFHTDDKRECMCELAQLSHAFFLYSDFDHKKESFVIRRAKTKTISVPVGVERYHCPSCDYIVDKKEFDKEREVHGQQQFDDASQMIASVVPPELLNPAPPEVEGMATADPSQPQPPQQQQGGGVAPGALLHAILKHEQGEMMNAPVTCPDCGAEMEVQGFTVQESAEVPDGFEDVAAGDFDDRLVTSFEVLIDERHAKGGNTDKAHWLCYRPLTPLYAIQQRYENMTSELKFQSETDWSEASQWLRALETSGDIIHRTNSQLYGIDRLFEPEYWWFTPEACGTWREPEGWELKDEKDTVLFDIRKDETVREACMRNFGKFEGLRIEFLGDEIKKVATEKLTDRWKSGHWLVNATSFWGKGLETLLDLQQIVNVFINMMYEHAEHTSMPHRIIDGLMFDHEDFQNRAGHVSYTRKGFVREKPIKDYIADLSPQQMSGEVFGLFSYILGPGKQDVTGVSAGSVGISDPNVKTAHGQSLSVQRALGMETPYFKSERRAVNGWLTNMTKIFQQNMPVEAYQYVKAANGEELKDVDIEIFKKMQIGHDIVLKDVEGTDMPQTHVEMRENYALAMQLGLFAPSEMSGIPPEVQTKMLKMLRIDWDANNFADQRRVAYIRLKKMKQEAEMRFSEAMAPDGSIDKNLITEILLSIPFLPRQDAHLVHIGILDAFCVAESAKPAPNSLLIALLQGRAMQHSQAMQAMQSEAVSQSAMAEGAAQRFRDVYSGQAGEKNADREDRRRSAADKSNGQSKRDDMPPAEDDSHIVKGLLDAHEKERGREHDSHERDKDRDLKRELAGSAKS